ncbi:MAG: FAD-binding protein [Rhodobacteraceae bacterium]|nr:FAD-binding protein [Paracoccaceae bacterium]
MTIPAALSALGELLGDRLSRSKHDLDLHGASETHFSVMAPDAVIYPTSSEEVAAAVRICREHGCPVIGFGAGTSLEGHTAAPRGGVSVDFSKMSSVLAINAADMDVVVQPGVTREALNEELRATGLFFPVDPGANASLGGMASTRASGTTAVRYGTMKDNVIALEVVTAEGEIIRTGTRARKSSAGYDLTGLFVGSEGTLGLITELTLRLQGIPEATAAAVCAFPSLGAAVETVIETIQCAIPMARIEVLDAASIAAVNAHAGRDDPPQPHLFVEFHGSPATVAEQAEAFGALAEGNGGARFEWSAQEEDKRALWAARHAAYYAILASRPGARAVVTDVCVPISRLAEAMEAAVDDIEQSSIPGPILGHVGDGNYHAILLIDPEDPKDKNTALNLQKRMVENALALGGTATGEHGVGMGKLDHMEAEHGAAWGLMGDIKRALDPNAIMNPGKLVRQN